MTVQNPSKVMQGQTDAMIGHAGPGEVVGPNLGRPIAATGLRLSAARTLRFLLRKAKVQQSGAEDFHRLELVLELGFLILLAHDDPRREVCDPYSRIGGIDALTARARGAEDV